MPYYGYRYYAPETGRWISRDPIEEKGGINLLAVLMNNPVNRWDRLGQSVGVTVPGSPTGYPMPTSPTGPTLPSSRPSTAADIAELQAMLQELAKSTHALNQRMKSLCPQGDVMVQWGPVATNPKQKQCCTRSSCMQQADEISGQIAKAVADSIAAQITEFGRIMNHGGWADNDVPNPLPDHGQSVGDAAAGLGLKCYGWSGLVADAFGKAAVKYMNSGALCFRGAALSKARWYRFHIGEHSWFGIYRPGTAEMTYKSADIMIDPWISGGSNLIQTPGKYTPDALDPSQMYWKLR